MSQPDPTLVAFDDVVVDLAGRRLLRGGVEQTLEPKAFGVLALMVQAPGRVFSRDELMDAVWGHRHVTPGVLNRVMTLVRHALGEVAQDARYLHTLHGVGYRFDLPTQIPREMDATDDPEPAGPSGLPATPLPAAPPSFARPSRLLWLAPLLVMLSLAGWGLWPRMQTVQHPSSTEHSIAVLPLANASGDANQQFFSDGLSENLIDALSRYDGLKVIGRTSSFQFRNTTSDSKAIGARLGVAYLVSGSVQRVGDTVRIGAELVDARDGHTMWTEHYDRPYKDLFKLQDEIARAVGTELQAKLQPSRSENLHDTRPPSGSLTAYSAYLQGMQSFYRQDMREMIVHESEATRLDPGYAMAWAQLSVAWALLGATLNGAEAQTAYRNSRVAVDKALVLAPDLGIAHGARGNLLLASEFNWQGAIAELRNGTRLAPENGQSHGALSRALAASGHLREAIDERKRFLAMDPLQPFNHFLYSDLMAATGKLDEAEKSTRTGSELQAQTAPSYQLMNIAILRNDAITARRIAEQQSPKWRDINIAVAAQLDPDRTVADVALAKAIANGTDNPYQIARAYALRGDLDGTLQWLERTWTARDTSIHHLLYDPMILRFRNEPRLAAFCNKIGLPAPSTSEALSIDQIRALSPAASRSRG